MSAAGEAAHGGGAQKGALQQHEQQPNPNEMFYTHNAVANENPSVPAANQRPAGGNAAAPAAASAEPFKRKRGRPRKYVADGIVPLAAVPPSPTTAGSSAPDGAGAEPTLPPGFCLNTEGGGMASHHAPPPPASEASPAKKKGRPATSNNKPQQQLPPPPQMAAPGGSGLVGLKPHMLTVQAGEDITSRAMSFSCNGWAVCILSANGAVSNVTMLQGDSSGGTVTYEGRFEILSLAGSYLLSDSAGLSSRTGGLSVSLAGPDGRVLGGSVAGPLIAASPVQVVIGSYLSGGKNEPDLSLAPGRLVYSALAPSSSPSRGTLSESSGGHGSPPNTAGSLDINQPGIPNFPPWK